MTRKLNNKLKVLYSSPHILAVESVDLTLPTQLSFQNKVDDIS